MKLYFYLFSCWFLSLLIIVFAWSCIILYTSVSWSCIVFCSPTSIVNQTLNARLTSLSIWFVFLLCGIMRSYMSKWCNGHNVLSFSCFIYHLFVFASKNCKILLNIQRNAAVCREKTIFFGLFPSYLLVVIQIIIQYNNTKSNTNVIQNLINPNKFL